MIQANNTAAINANTILQQHNQKTEVTGASMYIFIYIHSTQYK